MLKTTPITLLAASLTIMVAPQAVSAAMPGGSTIYAGLWTTDEATPAYGIYSLNTDGAELLLSDPKGMEVGYPLRSAWIDGGKLCGYYVKESYSVVEAMYYIEIDADGNTLKFEPLADDRGYMFAATFNPDDRTIYGYGLTADYSYALLKAPADDPGNITSVREFWYDDDEECMSIAYNTEDQKLYGINARGQFVSISTETGRQTDIVKVPISTETIISGMCFAPKEGLFYWNPQLSSGASAIYTVTPDGTQFTKVMDCAHNEQYNFLLCPDKAATAESPAAPVIKSVDFAGGAVSGSFVITLPDVTEGGGAITGTVTLVTTLDGEEKSRTEGAPGADVTVAFTDLAAGNHVFTFKAIAAGAVSENTSRKMWVGVDTPKATTKVTLTHDRVIWEPVTEGVNGGWIDLDNLEYHVMLNGEKAFSQGAASTSGFHSLSTAELKRYTASVVAVAAGKISEPTYSNELALGTPLEPSFSLIPDRDEVDKMTVIDVNGDGRTWSYSLYQECAKSSFGSGIPMDDWLILSPVAFKTGTSYTLEFDIQTCSSIYLEESLRVCIGESPAPEAMTTELVAPFSPTRELSSRSVDFTLPADGTYYIGFHTESAPDQEGLLLSNIRLHRTGESGIDTVASDNDTAEAPAEYFRLDGTPCIGRPATPGIYLLRTGSRVAKIAIR